DPFAGSGTTIVAAGLLERAGDHFTGPIDCGPHQTIGGPLENMAKHSEDFAAATWDKNGGSCSVTSDAVIAPDGNQTADLITAVTDTPVIQQQIADLADGGTYTFCIWARIPSGTRMVSIAIVDNAYATYLAGPTKITLTTSWQRFKITGTLASGRTGLWIVVRQYAANGDDWTTGDIHLWGACLQQGDDPQKAYARTWASQTPHVDSGLAVGPAIIAAIDPTTSPLKIHGPGSNLADSTLLELTANGELILAGGSGNGSRFAELQAANNPSGWAGVLKVKTPGGTTLGYILLYSNP
ncbi:MAG: phage head spike fiber domain-containing protein, partial [Bryobacteraceae bacterium]